LTLRNVGDGSSGGAAGAAPRRDVDDRSQAATATTISAMTRAGCIGSECRETTTVARV
jgi:hypothetical protein